MSLRNLSNDDLITNTISETKVEKPSTYSTTNKSGTSKSQDMAVREQKEGEGLNYIDPQLFQAGKSTAERPNSTTYPPIHEDQSYTSPIDDENDQFDVYNLRAVACPCGSDVALSFSDIFKKTSSVIDSGSTQNGDTSDCVGSGDFDYDDSSNGEFTASPDFESNHLSAYNTPAKLDAIRESDEESELMFLDSSLSIKKYKTHTPLISFSNINLLGNGEKCNDREKEEEQDKCVNGENSKEENGDEQVEQSLKIGCFENNTISDTTGPPIINVVDDTIEEDILYDFEEGLDSTTSDSLDGINFPKEYLKIPETTGLLRPLSTADEVLVPSIPPENPFNSGRSWNTSIKSTPAQTTDKKPKKVQSNHHELKHEEEGTKFELGDPIHTEIYPSNANSQALSAVSKEKSSISSTPKLFSTRKDALEVISIIESDQSSPIASGTGYKLPNMQHNNIYVNYNKKLRSSNTEADNIVDIGLNYAKHDQFPSFENDQTEKAFGKGNTEEDDGDEEVHGYDFKNLKSSFDFKSGISTPLLIDDRLTSQSNQNHTTSQIKGPSVLKTLDESTVHEAFTGTTACSRTPSVNLLSTDFGRHFSDSSLKEQTYGQVYESLKGKEDWIKSLNSAFELDANLFDELECMVNVVPSVKSNSSSDPQPNTASLLKSPPRPKSMMKTITQYNKRYGFKFSRSAVEKHNEKESNPPTSGNSIESYEEGDGAKGGGGGGSTGFLSRISTKINTISRPSSYDSNIQGFQDDEPEGKDETDNEDHHSEAISNIGISAPGTVTAKLFEDVGIPAKINTPPKKAKKEKHFIEVIKSLSNTGNSLPSLSFKSGTAEIEPNKPDDNYWGISNRFMDRKNPTGRSKTIRKIFTARSKGSGSFKDSSEQNTISPKFSNNEQLLDPKSSWGNSLFRGRSLHSKRITSQSLSLNSGVSLDGYAAKYALTQEFEPPKESQVLSTETIDARRIIQMSNITETSLNDFIDISNGYPVSRDSHLTDFTDTSGTMISSTNGQLMSTRAVENYTPTPVPGPQRSLTVLYRTRNLKFLSLKRNKSLNNVDSIRDQTITFSKEGRGALISKEHRKIDDNETYHYLNRNRSKLERSNSRVDRFLFVKNRDWSSKYQQKKDVNVKGPSHDQVGQIQTQNQNRNDYEVSGKLQRKRSLLKRFKSVYRK